MPRKRRRRGPSPLDAGSPTPRALLAVPSATILQLPPEMLAHVFGFLPFAASAETLRLVCHRFRNVAELVLNTALPRLSRQLGERARRLREWLTEPSTSAGKGGVDGGGVAVAAPKEESTVVRRKRMLVCRAYTAVCAARAQLDLLHAATWRYTQSLHPGHAPPACFYGGRVLDNAARVLHMAARAPEQLGTIYFRRDSVQAQAGSADNCDRWHLVDDAKRFINHFERVTERSVNTHPSDWGGKAIDLLHCLVDGPRALQSCSSSIDSTAGVFRFDGTWQLRRSWFLSVTLSGALDPSRGAPAESGYSWREDAGYMHLRVRRLVCAHNNHLLHPQRHTRMLLGPAPADAPSPLPGAYASVYSGFGDYAGRFYYYGNMNARALRSKVLQGSWPPPPLSPLEPLLPWPLLPLPPLPYFPAYPSASHSAEAFLSGCEDENDDDEEELLAVLEADPEVDLNLYIKVKLECPLRLAPFHVLRRLSPEDLDNVDTTRRTEPYLLTIDLYSPENARQRLPTSFHWQMPPCPAPPTSTTSPASPPSTDAAPDPSQGAPADDAVTPQPPPPRPVTAHMDPEP